MAECLMASRGFSPWLLLPQEQATCRLSKDHLPFFLSPGTIQDILKSSSVYLRLQQKEDLWKTMSTFLDAKQIIQTNTYAGRHALVDVQGESHSNSVLFSLGIAEKCKRQEEILKFLMSGSSEVERSGIDLSTLIDLMCSQDSAIVMPQWPSGSNLAEPQPSLICPSNSFSLQIPPSDVVGVLDHDIEIAPLSDGRLSPSGPTTLIEMNDVLSIISEFYQFKHLNSINSGKQPMVVPYFDRKITRESKVKSSAPQKLETVKAATLTRATPKKKSNKKPIKENDLYRNSHLHACESLLSILVDKKRQGRTAINSLKKSGSELPHLLTQFSAIIAGTGLAVLLSVVCKLACGRFAFCAPKIFNTGLSLALFWLSWSVNNLRDTVISISRSSGKLGEREDEMMNNLDKNVKEIYFRAATLMAIAALRFV